jgi:hypothetical protein
MKNTMVDVRNHMIAQLERLGDATPEERPGEIERAKAIGALCSVLIESAKTEIQWMRDIDGAVPTGFLPEQSTNHKRLK